MNLAVIGGGRMGSSLIRGLLTSGIVPADAIRLTSSTPERAALTAASLGVGHDLSNLEAATRADVIVLSVKPAKALDVVSGMAGALGGKLLISMVAGIRSADLASAAGPGCRIIRVMPNTAIRLLKGMTAISSHDGSRPEDTTLAERLFGAVGSVERVSEAQLDVVTAVSGSGPAFALLMLEAMTAEGTARGLGADQARMLTASAFSAAADLVRETGENPSQLREEITSPGGTTAAGLRTLEEGNFTQLVRAAVAAAAARSAELSSPAR